MSHYNLIVVTDADVSKGITPLEEALYPYDENLFYMQNPPQEDKGEVEEEIKNLPAFEAHILNTVTAISPKWDWWVIGGRWNGGLLLRSPRDLVELYSVEEAGTSYDPPYHGTFGTNIAFARDIDWPALQEENACLLVSRAGKLRMAIEKVRKDPISDVELYSAAEEFNSHPEMRKGFVDLVQYVLFDRLPFSEVGLLNDWSEVNDLLNMSLVDLYVMGYNAFPFHALLTHTGEWLEAEDEWWKGPQDHHVAVEEFSKKAWEYIHSLPPDYVVYLIDIHI